MSKFIAFPLKHLDNCTPYEPCACCKAEVLLTTELSPSAYDMFCDITVDAYGEDLLYSVLEDALDSVQESKLPKFPIEHLKDCVPGKTCACCKAFAHLKNELSPVAYENFIVFTHEVYGKTRSFG